MVRSFFSKGKVKARSFFFLDEKQNLEEFFSKGKAMTRGVFFFFFGELVARNRQVFLGEKRLDEFRLFFFCEFVAKNRQYY